ncbi:MAG TPA: DUF4386 domain-containing protein [Puia sp.]|jgi:hypothetical protein|nr:DUF4386 domain-containing protein [Puia sp.]
MSAIKSEFSPQLYARAGGAAYLIIIVAGFLAEMFIRSRLIVSGDPAGTAQHIIAQPLLWRTGIALDLLMHICDAIVSIVYYVLLKPVNKTLALISLFLGLVQTAVLVASKINLVMPLLLLSNSDYLKSLDSHTLQTLAYLSIVAHDYGYGIGLIFFGCACLIDGWLIIKSGYFPRILGFMIQIAGTCYLVNSFALILSPALAHAIFPAILLPSLIGELSMSLWLLFKGVNLAKWKEVVTDH